MSSSSDRVALTAVGIPPDAAIESGGMSWLTSIHSRGWNSYRYHRPSVRIRATATRPATTRRGAEQCGRPPAALNVRSRECIMGRRMTRLGRNRNSNGDAVHGCAKLAAARREADMTIVLDHTIVPAHDNDASARFFARIFGLP